MIDIQENKVHVNLSLKKRIWKLFQKKAIDEDISASKKIERLMERDLKND